MESQPAASTGRAPWLLGIGRAPLALALLTTLVACGKPDLPLALALEREVERVATERASGDALWPGFDPLRVPLAVYDGEQTFLFRHPSPPAGFVPVPGASPATHTFEGRHEAMTANTSADLGGTPTATILLERMDPGRPLRDVAAVAVHEAFHVHQRARHPSWAGNEADLFTYPSEAAELLALRRLETAAFRSALEAGDPSDAACWTRKALAVRGERYARMDGAFAAYERGTERNEGLATYVEMRAAGRREVALPPEEFGPAEVRRRAYAVGAALALLLDRFLPGWPARFEATEDRPLDAVLGEVVGTGPVCAFDDRTVGEADARARADVAELAADRARRVDAFEARAGWRVVVETGDGEPLWPQGFDPLNVERVAPQRVLHSRFLRLGNGAGQLEVLNAAALTEGAGQHPLFQGIRRVVVTGLERPEVREAEGTVSLEAPGVKLEFQRTRVAGDGEVLTLYLGS